MKNIYERPELKAVCFSNEDIVTVSGEGEQKKLIDLAGDSLNDGSLRIKGRNSEHIAIVVF